MWLLYNARSRLEEAYAGIKAQRVYPGSFQVSRDYSVKAEPTVAICFVWHDTGFYTSSNHGIRYYYAGDSKTTSESNQGSSLSPTGRK